MRCSPDATAAGLALDTFRPRSSSLAARATMAEKTSSIHRVAFMPSLDGFLAMANIIVEGESRSCFCFVNSSKHSGHWIATQSGTETGGAQAFRPSVGFRGYRLTPGMGATAISHKERASHPLHRMHSTRAPSGYALQCFVAQL